MIFIALASDKTKMTKEIIAQNLKLIEKEAKEDGIKVVDVYWTVGHYDGVFILDAPDEKAVIKWVIARGDWMKFDTLVAVPASEARKLIPQ